MTLFLKSIKHFLPFTFPLLRHEPPLCVDVKEEVLKVQKPSEPQSKPFTSLPKWNFWNTGRKKQSSRSKTYEIWNKCDEQKRTQAVNSSLPHSICLSQHCFFSVHSSRKIRHVHSSEVALGVGQSDVLSPSTADLRSPYSSPHSADFGFATLVAGCRSSQSFDVPANLAKGLAKKSAYELSEFDLVGNPTFPSRYAISHRFSTLTIVFSFSCSKISILEEI
ncbi:hypothetical protein AVEN_176460-1 [Araneus ventricosus]|uniref:Uncharacterized protein n=1 Tax=Araneus ventricosus TaxID=182803 RepID=A0A4Y2JM23_ARAVE|nr:hypothetical protein AVEN_176460-1 [Araneus ventricosus]